MRSLYRTKKGIELQTNLPAVQGDGGEGESRDVQRAVLYKATDVTHCPPKHPGAVHKPDLREEEVTWIIASKHQLTRLWSVPL